jgi:hypothetical protein
MSGVSRYNTNWLNFTRRVLALTEIDASRLPARIKAYGDYTRSCSTLPTADEEMERTQAVVAVFRAAEEWELNGQPAQGSLVVALDKALAAFEKKYLSS